MIILQIDDVTVNRASEHDYYFAIDSYPSSLTSVCDAI